MVKPPFHIIRPALKSFAQELRAARIHSGMTRQGLARRAGMTRQGLMKVENGGNVTLGTVILLANALGYQVSDFFRRRSPWD
jgi:transcriptional regulator with XRE-family HTH domain